jgi:hypothetical protein
MLVGCAASWLASAVGGAALLASERGGRGGDLKPPLVAMVVRLGVVIVLGVALALSGRVERTPLLLWIGISHLVLLLADARFAVEAVRRRVVSSGSLESGAR